MPSEQLQFILESITSIVGIAALVAIAIELQRARRADAREFLFHTYEKFSGIHKHRVLVENLEIIDFDDWLLGFNDEAISESQTAVFNFWDLLTRTVRDSSINSKIAVEHFGRVFMTYYEKYSPYHHQFRKLEGDSEWTKSFDWFAEKYSRHLPGDWEAFQTSNSYREKLFAESE